jgi:hypothetical protein
MIGFLIGLVLVGVYWIALIVWGVFARDQSETWAGWRARVPDVLFFIVAAIALGLLMGWHRAALLAQVGGLILAVRGERHG